MHDATRLHSIALPMPTVLLLLACTQEIDTHGTAALAPLSDDECPDLTKSGTSTFRSSGEDRQVTVVLPTSPKPGMSVNVYFHGTAFPTDTSTPAADIAARYGVQVRADATNTVWLMPDARVQTLLDTVVAYLWDVMAQDEADVVLFDDLRTCAAENLDVDLTRLSAVGFSAGALWTTVLIGQRADTLAGDVELSGGSDAVVPGLDHPFAPYTTPVTSLPVLMTTGAEGQDVWPTPELVMVDFNAATGTLQGKLLADGHFTVRCRDDEGHVEDDRDWEFATAWTAAQQFGQPSPYETEGLGSEADWCLASDPGA